MQRMVLVMAVVMVVAVLPYAGAIECYDCTGYYPDLPEDPTNNNKHCPSNKFDEDKVPTGKGLMCMYMVEELNGVEVTVRSGWIGVKEPAKKSETSRITFSGYLCDTDYCNSSPNTRALCPSLLLVPLLASLLRWFA